MRVTRRYRALAGVALSLAALAALADRPLSLVGATAVGAALLCLRSLFVRRLRRTLDALSVDLSVSQRSVTRGQTTPVTLRAGLSDDVPLSVSVTADPPVSADAAPAAERRLSLPGAAETLETTFSVTWAVAGTAAFDPPTVSVADPFGLFESTVRLGPSPSVTVEPRRPDRLHVGEGGDRVSLGAGDHRAGRLGSGLEPAELRRYVPGDDASDIDWKATARLGDTHVREQEVETDRRTVLLFDHRQRLGEGSPGETQLDYLREVALTFVDRVRSRSDPLGLYAVGDEGLTVERPPAADEGHYRRVHTLLHDLAPTTSDDGEIESAVGRYGPQRARRRAARLDPTASAFDATLRPFLADPRGYVDRMDGDPLFATAKTHLHGLGGRPWTMVFTDDADRAQLRETVRLAANGGDVVVFLAPRVLFEPGGLADLEGAYERYADFEEFRRDLAGMAGVSAFEVGPGDRIDAILSTGRRATR